MVNSDGKGSALVDRDNLPVDWPTHRHEPEFWENFGRAVAAFGFLEDTLRRAIFAYTGTRPIPPEEAAKALNDWRAQLERIVTAPLWNLAAEFEAAANANPKNSTDNISELVAHIKAAASIRNILCHGSWMAPDSDGKSVPLFIKKDRATKELMKFEEEIDNNYLLRVRAHVVDLICSTIDTVTHMGYQFPGGGGPGEPVWS